MKSEIFWKVMEHSSCINELASYDHGPAHWARVMRNGRMLAEKTEGSDLLVVEMFALFHDSMRQSEFSDPEHGLRGKNLAYKIAQPILKTMLFDQLKTFEFACVHHDEGEVSDDPTIGVCWDADRLDLPRVGIQVDSRFLSTNAAKEVISNG